MLQRGGCGADEIVVALLAPETTGATAHFMNTLRRSLCLVSLIACAAAGCAAESESISELAAESDALVRPRITTPASGMVSNSNLDGITAASLIDAGTNGKIQPYMFDLRANRTGVVTLANAQAIANSLYGARVLRVTQRILIPATPAGVGPGVRLLAQASGLARDMGSLAAQPSELAWAIAALDPRSRAQAKVFEVQFKPGQSGPQSTFLMFDEGARAGRGACLAASAKVAP